MNQGKSNQSWSIKPWLERHLNREKGQIGEDIAAKYLKDQGLTLVTTNFNCRFGELDLIMTESDKLVFVEVKMRSKDNFGGAIHAVSPQKQRKLIKTAQWYMQQHSLSDKFARFDVVAIDHNNQSKQPDIKWIQNAFYSQ